MWSKIVSIVTLKNSSAQNIFNKLQFCFEYKVSPVKYKYFKYTPNEKSGAYGKSLETQKEFIFYRQNVSLFQQNGHYFRFSTRFKKRHHSRFLTSDFLFEDHWEGSFNYLCRGGIRADFFFSFPKSVTSGYKL